MTNTTTSTSIKWWWNKKSKPVTTKKQRQKSATSSINGADEDASMFSLYSCGGTESIYSPSSARISCSIRAQHTKSEYSGNFSDVESNASILSKPWISRNMIEDTSIHQQSPEEKDNDGSTIIPDENDDDEEAYSAPLNSTDNLDDSRIIISSSSTSSIQSQQPKRRGSLVDYIVKKPIHGKLKAGFGRLVGRSHSNEESFSSINNRRRSYG